MKTIITIVLISVAGIVNAEKITTQISSLRLKIQLLEQKNEVLAMTLNHLSSRLMKVECKLRNTNVNSTNTGKSKPAYSNKKINRMSSAKYQYLENSRRIDYYKRQKAVYENEYKQLEKSYGKAQLIIGKKRREFELKQHTRKMNDLMRRIRRLDAIIRSYESKNMTLEKYVNKKGLQ